MENKNTNILCQYDGGGFDGCIWEYNFFYIDKEGIFNDIYSSGVGTITTLEQATYLIDNGSNSFSSRVYVYHLDNEEELTEFAKETHAYLVKIVMEYFEENFADLDDKPFAVCSKCERKIYDCEDIMPSSDYNPEIICHECYSLNSCAYCGEYFDSEDYLTSTVEQVKAISEYDVPEKTAQKIMDNYGPLCEYCLEDLLNKELDKLIKKTKED